MSETSAPKGLSAENKRLAFDLSAKLQLEGLEHIVTVSAGALALLVTFRANLVTAQSQDVWLLKFSWIGLGASVLLAVWFKLAMAEALGRSMKNFSSGDRIGNAADRMSTASAICFSVGVSSLAAFGIVNL